MSADDRLFFEWNGVSCLGNRGLLESRKVVLLNSSQGKQPTGSDLWVRGTLRAAEAYAREDYVLLSSVGLNTWELTCWAAGNFGIPQIIAVPDDGSRSLEAVFRGTVDDFALERETVCLMFLPSKPGKPKSFWEHRDRKLTDLAQLLVPIGVKRGGRIDSILRESGRSERTDTHFRAECSGPRPRDAPSLPRKEDIRRNLDTLFSEFLIHWTRASDGPWPGETRADYYKAVAESDGEYPRSGERTLERIVREKRIRASSWRIRGGHPVVSFTSLPPSEAVHLMRWRKRYARYTVEPYGIAVREDVATAAGTRPVEYIPSEEAVQSVPDYLVQGKGAKAEWPLEREYRHLGDFDLAAQPDGSWEAIDLSVLRRGG